MNQSKLFKKAIALLEAGESQKGADILFALAREGHLESIEQLTYIFLDQEEIDVVNELLDSFADQENNTILYLRAKVVEAQKGFDYQAYLKAAHAGSSSAALVLFEFHLPQDLDTAKVWFELAQKWGHPNIDHFAVMLEVGGSNSIPEDINDVDQWNDDFETNFNSATLEALFRRADEFKAVTMKELIDEEVLSAEFAVDLILQLINRMSSTRHQLEFLQCGMSTWRKWDETSFDGFHIEFLSLMEMALDLISEWKLSMKELSAEFRAFVDQDFMWRDPLVITSMIALKQVSSDDIDFCAEKLLAVWDKNFILIEDNSLDLMETDLWDLTPLVALVLLKGALSKALSERLLEVTAHTDYEDFSLGVWEYVSGYISEGVEDCYWAPHVVWRDGFFRDVFRRGCPIDEKAVVKCLEFFWNNLESFDLENPYGEKTLQNQVLEIILRHPKVNSEVKLGAKKFLKSQS